MQYSGTGDAARRGGVPGGELRLKLVARLALGTSLVALAVLLAVIWLLGNGSGATYFETVRTYAATQKNLPTALLLSALGILALVSAVTWLVALYSSFRIAGPLYRFARNLELAHTTLELPAIRRDDGLQEESRQLLASVEALRQHYRSLAQLVEQAQRQLDPAAASDPERLRCLIQGLKEQTRRVQID